MQRDKGRSFLRVFSILEKVSAATAPLSLSDLSDDLDIPRPTVHRLCQMLMDERLLEKTVEGNRFLAGPRLFEFAHWIIGSSHLNLERKVILESLVEAVRETCNLAVPDGHRMVYADRVESSWPLQLQLPTGTHVPLYCTASGKLYLSSLSDDDVRHVISRLHLERRTPATMTDPDDLLKELARVRAAGFSWDNEEFLEGLIAIAVPVHNSLGQFCAALTVHAPTRRMSLEDAKTRLPALRRAAARIEHLICREAEKSVA